LTPGVKPFVGTGAGTPVHDLNTDSAGYQRNSKGVTGLVGTSFHRRGTPTREVAFGAAQRTYKDFRLDKLARLIGEASVIWNTCAPTSGKLRPNRAWGIDNFQRLRPTLARYRRAGRSLVPVPASLHREFGFGVDS